MRRRRASVDGETGVLVLAGVSSNKCLKVDYTPRLWVFGFLLLVYANKVIIGIYYGRRKLLEPGLEGRDSRG